MNEGDIGSLMHATVTVVIKLSGPPLVAALVVGLIVSLVQVITQINEQTLALLPKIAAVIGTLVLLGPFMLVTLKDFVHLILDKLVAVGGS